MENNTEKDIQLALGTANIVLRLQELLKWVIKNPQKVYRAVYTHGQIDLTEYTVRSINFELDRDTPEISLGLAESHGYISMKLECLSLTKEDALKKLKQQFNEELKKHE